LDKSVASSFSHQNNFDLIRLFAAAQVALVHAVYHLDLRLPFHDTSFEILKAFPGVPIFFVISGFLISASYDRSKSISDFFKNRVLRIFPALWLCFALSVTMIFLTGYFASSGASAGDFAIWAFSQMSFLQFYNPSFMRGFGEGVINGSLWTIPVEMQFYVLTPAIFLIYKIRKSLFWAAMLVLITANFALSSGYVTSVGGENLRKLVSVTFVPWIYMFLLGFIAYRHWSLIKIYVENQFLKWLAVYAALASIGLFIDIGIEGNKIALPWVIVMAMLVLSAAFTRPRLSDAILRRNDISYGMYIYHMPVYNFVIYKLGQTSNLGGWIALSCVPFIALLSWKLIEKPALSLKRFELSDIKRLIARSSHSSSDLP
jgi:peptidoglycan/LPS O-acetylase OafA/YrhL